MSRTITLSKSGSVTLSASGAGQVSLGPAAAGTVWYPAAGSCITSADVSVPVFQVYLNEVTQSNFVGGSQTGNNDTCSIGAGTLYPGQVLIGVWTGGDSGATATFNISGTQEVPG
jgi:hypothetical protein